MEYEQLEEVNKQLKPITLTHKDKNGKISSNDYNTVNQRVLAFRKIFPEGSIQTEIVSHENSVILMKATVYDGVGRVLAIGHASEEKELSFINKTSYIENCETSAVGRALGFLGIGIKEAIASAEEIEKAEEEKQKELEKNRTKALNDLRTYYEQNGGKDFEAWLKQVAPDGMTNDIYKVELARIKKEITDKADAKKGEKK